MFFSCVQIRPIDKRLQYQLEKLLRTASTTPSASKAKAGEEDDDALKYRPNPASLVAKDGANGTLVSPPSFPYPLYCSPVLPSPPILLGDIRREE